MLSGRCQKFLFYINQHHFLDTASHQGFKGYFSPHDARADNPQTFDRIRRCLTGKLFSLTAVDKHVDQIAGFIGLSAFGKERRLIGQSLIKRHI
ncbi:MAG: hypothetical protein BWY75_03497 [bacterium ADurb.Bin425]|nr:MAG: hypothetical protein BWY75_03497 [bacterium ADurb.Bin425]